MEHYALQEPLMEFYPISSDHYRGRLLDDSKDKSKPCPKCNCLELYAAPKVCKGKSLGRCGIGCSERREHFHVKCKFCGWRTKMATKDASKD